MWFLQYRASQGDPSSYGLGCVLFLSYSHKISFKVDLGINTNNYAKQTTLLLLLKMCSGMKCHQSIGIC
jgi:hypothetical protein